MSRSVEPRKENPRRFYAIDDSGLELASLERGSSRRITVMRSRPANIRVIHRRCCSTDRLTASPEKTWLWECGRAQNARPHSHSPSSYLTEGLSISELEARHLTFERERQVMIYYRNRPLRSQRVDLIVEGEVLIEIKAVERLAPVHEAQVLSYLRATGLRVGLLMNFNRRFLRHGLRRVVL